MRNLWRSEFEFKNTSTGSTQYLLDDRFKINENELLNTNDIHFKLQNCLNGSSYQYIKSLDDIYDKSLLTGDNFSINNMYNEFNIIDKYLENLHRVDIAIGGKYNEEIDITKKYFELDGIQLIVGHTVLIYGQNDKVKNDIYVINHDYSLKLTDILNTREKADKAKFYIKLGTYTETQFFLLNESIIFPITGEEKVFVPYHSYIIKNKINYDINTTGKTGMLFSNYDVARHQQDNSSNLNNMNINLFNMSADFDFTRECTESDTNFQVLNTENVDSYLWNFDDPASGNLNSATTEDPSHLFDYGVYDVSLTVFNHTYSCSDTVIKHLHLIQSDWEIFIHTFSQDYCINTDILFNGSVVPETASTWTWDFDDGNTSTLQNPTHQYTSTGEYVVSLSVNNGTCSQTKLITMNIGGGYVLDFDVVDDTCCVNKPVVFINNSSIVLLDSVDWLWEFGDTYTSTDINPTHSYNFSGYKNVTLTATATGATSTCVTTKTINNIVEIKNPIFNLISISNSSNVFINVLINFTSSVMFAPPPYPTYLWEFGDGGTSTLSNPDHTYITPGEYTYSLTVTDGYCSKTLYKTIDIYTQPFEFQLVTTLINDFSIWFEENIDYDVMIDWGDNSPIEHVVGPLVPSHYQIHNYSVQDTYIVKLYGKIPELNFNKSYSLHYITKIINWGVFSTTQLTKLSLKSCHNLNELPSDSSELKLQGNHDGVFYNTRISEIPLGLFDNCNITSINKGFSSNDSLTIIPEKLFSENIGITDFGYCFANCSGLTTIPENIFSGNTAAIDFYLCFMHDTFTSIPENLFITNINAQNFAGCFYDCAGLTSSVPQLWDTTIWTSVVSYDNCFSGVPSPPSNNIPTSWGGSCTLLPVINCSGSN